MKRFEVCDLNTDRTYEVGGNENTTIDDVWESQKCWFSSGAFVEITDEDGNKKTFQKR